MKRAYICGPLAELAPEERDRIRSFYVKIADLCTEVLGTRGYVPHEKLDPIDHPLATPEEVDHNDRDQVCNHTSVLIVVAVAPSWGGGIEVEMANQSHVPVIVLCSKSQLAAGKVSRLLRGNPAVKYVIAGGWDTYLLDQLYEVLLEIEIEQ